MFVNPQYYKFTIPSQNLRFRGSNCVTSQEQIILLFQNRHILITIITIRYKQTGLLCSLNFQFHDQHKHRKFFFSSFAVFAIALQHYPTWCTTLSFHMVESSEFASFDCDTTTCNGEWGGLLFGIYAALPLILMFPDTAWQSSHCMVEGPHCNLWNIAVRLFIMILLSDYSLCLFHVL